jgi:2-methylisocitrate lyase-like PEP mutase family enzyme
VLIDADDGYGDVKNVSRTVRGYEALGASAIFTEDQQAPKRCGHMAGGSPCMSWSQKCGPPSPHGNPPRRLFSPAPTRSNQKGSTKRCGGPSPDDRRKLQGRPLATTILERGGKTPWVPPQQMYDLGFDMVLYPTSLLFRITRAMQVGLAALRAGLPLPADDSLDMEEFEDIVGLSQWAEIENRFQPSEQEQRTLMRIVNAITG